MSAAFMSEMVTLIFDYISLYIVFLIKCLFFESISGYLNLCLLSISVLCVEMAVVDFNCYFMILRPVSSL